MHKRFTWIYSFGIFAFKSTLFILNCATLKWMSCQNRENYNIYSLLLNWILKNWMHFLWLINLNAFMQVSTTHSLCLFLLQLGKRFYECYRLLLSLSSLQNPLTPPSPRHHSPIGSINFNFSTFIIINLRPGPDPDPVAEAEAEAEAGPGLHFKSTRHFRCWQ